MLMGLKFGSRITSSSHGVEGKRRLAGAAQTRHYIDAVAEDFSDCAMNIGLKGL